MPSQRGEFVEVFGSVKLVVSWRQGCHVEFPVVKKHLNALEGAAGMEPVERGRTFFTEISMRFDDLKPAVAARDQLDGRRIPGVHVDEPVSARLELPPANEIHRRVVFINRWGHGIRSREEIWAAIADSGLVKGRVQRIKLSDLGTHGFALLERASDAAALADAGRIYFASGGTASVAADKGQGTNAIMPILGAMLQIVNHGDPHRKRSRSRSRNRDRKEPRRYSRTPPPFNRERGRGPSAERGTDARADGYRRLPGEYSRAVPMEGGTQPPAPPPSQNPPSTPSSSTSPLGAGAGGSPAPSPSASRPDGALSRYPPVRRGILGAVGASEEAVLQPPPPLPAAAPAATAPDASPPHELQPLFRPLEEQLASVRTEVERRASAAAAEADALKRRVAELERERGDLVSAVQRQSEQLAEQSKQIEALRAAEATAVPLDKYEGVKVAYWMERKRVAALEAQLLTPGSVAEMPAELL